MLWPQGIVTASKWKYVLCLSLKSKSIVKSILWFDTFFSLCFPWFTWTALDLLWWHDEGQCDPPLGNNIPRDLRFESRSLGSGVSQGHSGSVYCVSDQRRHFIKSVWKSNQYILRSLNMVLTLFSEPECGGQSVVVRDKEVNLTKAGVNFKVKVH